MPTGCFVQMVIIYNTARKMKMELLILLKKYGLIHVKETKVNCICSSFDKSNGYQIEDTTREIGKVKISL